MTKKKKLWILVAALAVVLAAAVTAGAFLLPGLLGSDEGNSADPKVSWYSEKQDEFVITTADELYDLAYLSSKYNFEGQKIVLGADIIVNPGNAEDWLTEAPERLWYPIDGFNGTFDGQGHSISGLYGLNFTDKMGLFSNTGEDCTVKNLKVLNSCFVAHANQGTGVISSNGGGTFDTIYTNAIIASTNWNNGGIIGKIDLSGDTLINNCWYDGKMILTSDQGRVAGGMVGDITMESGVCTISHCLNTASFSAEAQTHTGRGRLMDIGGIVGRASGGTTNISDCFSSATIDSDCVIGAGVLIGSSGKSTTNMSHSYAVIRDNITGVGYRYNKTVGDVYNYTESYVLGYNAYKWTTLDFEEYWAVDEDGFPVLQSFADVIPELDGIEREIDTSWYNKTKTYRISNYKQLLGLHIVSQWDNMSGKFINLTDDIVVQEGDASTWREKAPEIMWKRIGSANTMFAGTFDGLGHSISGVYYKSSSNGGGFFTALGTGATVRNFKLLNSYFECDAVTAGFTNYNYTGSIAGYAQGATLDKVYSNAIIVNDGYYSGGLVGLMRNGKASLVNNCWFDGEVHMHGINTGMRGGGVVGCVWNTTLTMTHTLFTGTMTGESWAWGANEGIMVGYPNAKSTVIIEDSLCAGSLTVLDGKKDGNGMMCGRIAADANVIFDDAYAIKTPDPKAVEGETPWYSNWGLTGYRGAPVTFNGPGMILEAKYLTGYAAYQYTGLDFENFWAVDPKGHPVLQAFMAEDEKAPDLSKYSRLVDYSWYNSGSDTYYISNRAQLVGFSLLATADNFKDKTIVLTNNISLNSGNAANWDASAPYYEWIPVGNADNMFQGTFNGAGRTISGLFVSEPKNGLGMFGMVKNATIKNLRLTNSFVESYMCADTLKKGKLTNYNYIGGIAGYAANSTFDTIYTNVIVKNDGDYTGGILGMANTKENPVTFRNCWFDGTLIQAAAAPRGDGSYGACYTGGIIGLVRNTDATISHCLSTATMSSPNMPEGTWGTVAGGMIGRTDFTGTNPAPNVTISDSLANITWDMPVSTQGGNGSVISQANPGTKLKLKNVYSVVNGWKGIATNRCTEQGGSCEGDVGMVAANNVTGSSAYIYTTLDFGNYWSALEGKTPQLKSFASGKVAQKITVDTSWYDEDATEYILNTADELMGFAQLSKKNTFEGKTIKLGADIVMNEGDSSTWGETAPAKMWISIGSVASRFKGTFDGQGHTISGLCLLNNGAEATGMFECIDGATVKNFKLVNSYFDDAAETDGTAAWSKVGAVVGVAYSGTVSDIYTDAYVSGGSMFNGGIVGLFRASGTNATVALTISNCWYDGILDLGATGRASGGILGGVVDANANFTTANIENCLMTGTINSQYVGEIDLAAYNKMTIVGGGIGSFINCKMNLKDILIAGEMNMAEGATYVGSLYGNKNWGVSPASACEGVYILDDVYSQVHYVNPENGHNNMTNWTDISKVARDDMLGGKARNTAAGLDFTESGAWIAVADKLPELRLFSDAEEAPVVADPNAETTEWYTGDQTEYVINTLGEMKGFITLSQENDFAGITIKLNTDIKWNDGDASTWATTGPNNTLKFIGSATKPFKGTFDGQGHTISGAYYKSTVGSTYVGMFADVEGATIKNLIIANSAMHTTSGSGGNGILVGRAKGVTIENVKVESNVYATNSTYSGIVAYAEGANAVSFKNVWMAGNIKGEMWMTKHGGLLGGSANSNGLVVTVDTCLFTGKMTQTHTTTDAENYVGGFVGGVGADVKLVVKNSLSAGAITKLGGSTVYAGSVAGITSWRGAAYTTFENVYATKESGAVATYRTPDMYTGTIEMVNKANILGGLARWTLPNLDFTETGAWIAVEDAIPELRYFSDATDAPEVENPGEGGTDPDVPADPNEETTAWYDAEKTEFVLKTFGEFKGFVTLSKSTNFAGKTIKLDTDISYGDGVWSVANATWTPIGTKDLPFAGTFDGQGHTVSGLLTQKNTGGYHGMFGVINGATIKNLRIENSTFHPQSRAAYFAGSVAAYATNSTITNVYSNAVLYAAEFIGGMVAHVDGTTDVDNCWFDGTIHSWNASTTNVLRHGGIVGRIAADGSTIDNCLFTGTVDGVYGYVSDDSNSYLGGIVGVINYNRSVRIANCLSAGSFAEVTPAAGVQVGSVVAAGSAQPITGGNNFATTECYSAMITGRPENLEGMATQVAQATILGEDAKTVMTGFDFENIWETVEGKTPKLRLTVTSDPGTDPDEPDVPDVPDVPVDPNEETTAWYSDSATEFVISTVGEMKGFVTLSKTNTFSGKTVKLGADIVWNEGDAAEWATTAPANVWTPIGDQDNGFLGTFDGQGHTVSGLYCVDTGYASFVARLYSPGVVKNVAVVNSYFRSNGTTKNYSGAGIVSRLQNATVSGIYTDAIFEAVWDAGIVASVPSGNSTITNCWFDGTVVDATRAGGILGFGVDSKVHTISNCLFTGSISGTNTTADAYYGGLVGMAPWSATITMTNCLAAGDMTGVTSGIAGSVIGNNPGGDKSVYTNVYATSETHTNMTGANSTVSSFSTVTAVAAADIKGDLATTKLTGFDFTNTWTTVNGFVPVLKAFVAFAPEADEPGTDPDVPQVDPTVETTEWYNDTDTEFVISTVGEMKGFVTLSKTNTFEGKTIKLGADIVWNEGDAAEWAITAPANAWTPIGDQDNGFKGVFDGQGHTISGLYVKNSGYAAFVARMYGANAAVKNVAIVNSYFESDGTGDSFHNGAGIVGRANNAATVSGVYTDAFLKGVKGVGMVAFADSVLTCNISNCWFNGTIDVTGATNVGGMIGLMPNNTTAFNMSNCLFTGTMTGTAGSGAYIGGLVGIGAYNTVINMSNCLVAGDMTAITSGITGSVIGNNPGNASKAVYTNVYATSETHTNMAGANSTVSSFSTVTAVAAADIKGDLATTKLTGFDFTETWLAVEGFAPVLKAFEAFKPVDPTLETTAWYNDTDTEFTISTLGELKGFVTLSKTNTFAGKTIKLGADIVINEGDATAWADVAPAYNWTPIGGDATFDGTFDGQGHTISGLYCAHPSGNSMGMFREITGTVTNFKLVNSYLVNTAQSGDTGWGYNGVIASTMKGGTISKVYTNATIVTVDSYAGGIVGYSYGTTATIEQCQFDGVLKARCSIDSGCSATATVAENYRSHARYVGGIAGAAIANNTYIYDCIFSGRIYNEDLNAHRTSGIVGGTPTSGMLVTVKRCFSIGKLGTMGHTGNSYHFNMILDTRDTANAKNLPVNSATLYTDNYILTTPAYKEDDTTINNGGNISGANGISNTIRFTLDEMIAKVANEVTANTSNLDFENVWTYNEGALPTLKAFAD